MVENGVVIPGEAHKETIEVIKDGRLRDEVVLRLVHGDPKIFAGDNSQQVVARKLTQNPDGGVRYAITERTKRRSAKHHMALAIAAILEDVNDFPQTANQIDFDRRVEQHVGSIKKVKQQKIRRQFPAIWNKRVDTTLSQARAERPTELSPSESAALADRLAMTQGVKYALRHTDADKYIKNLEAK
jgi:hypothetical protein